MAPLRVSVLALGFVLAAVPAAAQAKPSTPELIARAASGGAIASSRAALFRAYAIARPERLPGRFRSDSAWDGTLVLLRLRRDLPRLPEAERLEIEALLASAGPGEDCDSEGKAQAAVLTTTHFYITYDSIAGGLNAAGYAASLERSWDKEVSQFGWAAPPVFTAAPPPGGRYHVRIDSLSPGLYGFVSPVGDHAGFVGDNPSTSWNDGDAYASCMVLNRDYSGFPSAPQAALDSTTGHEFNHSIQFGYGALAGANVPDDVFVEGGATWMEDEVHDAANDNYNYLWPVFADSLGDYDNSPYPYWITFRGFTERYGTGSAGGGEQVMQDFWELTSRNAASNQDAMATALAGRGTTLADAFHAYAIAAKFNRPCGGGYAYPYCFEEGTGYVAAAGATPVNASISSVGGSASSSVEDNYASAWVSLPTSGSPYNITLSGGGVLRGTVACDTGSGLSLSPLSGSGTLIGFSPTGCAARVLVVTNQAQTAANPTNSVSRSFSVTTGTSSPTSHTLSVTKTGSGSGTVTSNPAGINCGSDCSQSYAQGTSVTLTATPAAGSSFEGWGGACSGTASSCTVAMTTGRSVAAAFDLIPDETPPETTIISGPSGDTSDATPTFEFASSEAGSTFTCQIDDGDAVACSSPYTTQPLALGPHSLSVYATDQAGHPDPTAASRAFMVVEPPDQDLPQTVITAGPSGDTTDTAPTFAFESDEANSTFVCRIDAALPRACTSPYTTQSLALGPHRLSVYATDQAGNSDPTPAVRQFRVVTQGASPTGPSSPQTPSARDKVAPAVLRLRLSPAVFRAARSGPALSALAGTRLSITVSEPATVMFRVRRLLVGRSVGGRCVRPTDRNRRASRCVRREALRGRIVRALPAGTSRLRYRGRLASRALRPGRYEFLARARDVAGNRSVGRRATFVIVR